MGKRGPKPKERTFEDVMRRALKARCSPTGDIDGVERADAEVERWMREHHVTRIRLVDKASPLTQRTDGT